MGDIQIEIQTTFNPQTSEIDFLTQKINEESKNQNIQEEAYPFGIFIRKKTELETNQTATGDQISQLGEITEIVGGCNGSVVYGSIYTDQLWVNAIFRGKGYGKLLMEKVHEIGRQKQCSSATIGTMSFQGAQAFYEHLGYRMEFEREGYVNGAKMVYLKKLL